MDPLSWAMVGTGVASLIGNVITNNMNNDAAQAAADKQAQAEKDLLAYNSPAEQKQRLLTAGYNPDDFLNTAGNIQADVGYQVPTLGAPKLDFNPLMNAFSSAETASIAEAKNAPEEALAEVEKKLKEGELGAQPAKEYNDWLEGVGRTLLMKKKLSEIDLFSEFLNSPAGKGAGVVAKIALQTLSHWFVKNH